MVRFNETKSIDVGALRGTCIFKWSPPCLGLRTPTLHKLIYIHKLISLDAASYYLSGIIVSLSLPNVDMVHLNTRIYAFTIDF